MTTKFGLLVLLALILVSCLPQPRSMPKPIATTTPATIIAAHNTVSVDLASTPPSSATSLRSTATPTDIYATGTSTRLRADTPPPSTTPRENAPTTGTPIPQQTSPLQTAVLSNNVRQCKQISKEIAFSRDGASSVPRNFDITSMEFVSETMLQTRGWGSSGDGWSEASQVEFDLKNGKTTVLEMHSISPLSAFCQECNPYVFAESPKGTYQLAVYREKNVGIWIAGPTRAARISDFTPWSVDWVWAEDEHWAWLKWSGREFGMDSAFARMGVDIQVEELEPESPLSEMGHRIAIDPARGVAVSAGSGDYFIANGKLESYEMTGVTPVLLQSQTVSETLQSVTWDKDRRQFVLNYVEDNGIVIRFLDGQGERNAPKNIRDRIFGAMGPLTRNYSIPGAIVAVSPSGNRIAIVLDKIYVIECD